MYLLTASEPTLVETGPGADAPRRARGARRSSGIDADDLAHIVVTHIHLDHAGGGRDAARAASRGRRSGCTSEARRTSPIPTRLVASTARTYGEERMRAFFGDTAPVRREPDPASSSTATDRARRPRRSTSCTRPDTRRTTWRCTTTRRARSSPGEAIGSHLPWADCFRPALPPPEVDVEAALAEHRRASARGGADRAADLALRSGRRMPRTACDVRRRADRGVVRRGAAPALDDRPADRDSTISPTMLRGVARPSSTPRTPASRSTWSATTRSARSAMNAAGLARYWRKRWRRAATPLPANRRAGHLNASAELGETLGRVEGRRRRAA